MKNLHLELVPGTYRYLAVRVTCLAQGKLLEFLMGLELMTD